MPYLIEPNSCWLKKDVSELEFLDPQVGPFLRLWHFLPGCSLEGLYPTSTGMLESHFPDTSTHAKCLIFKAVAIGQAIFFIVVLTLIRFLKNSASFLVY